MIRGLSFLVGITLASAAASQPAAPPAQSGDESGYVPFALTSMTVNLDETPIGIRIFEATRNSAGGTKAYAFTPYFIFLHDKDGKRYTRIRAGDGTSTLKMRLALFDDELKQAVAAQVSEHTGQNIGLTAVQPLPIWRLSIAIGRHSYNIPRQTDNSLTRVDLQPVQDIFFENIPDVEADNLIKQIDSGFGDFRFSYSYKKGETSVGAYTVRYKDISSSNVFQSLTGNGGAGFVTRDGAARVGAAIAQSLEVVSYVEDSSAVAGLQQDVVALLFDKMKAKEAVDYSKQENLKKLAAIGIDPHGIDFEADKISRTHDVVATSKDASELNKRLNSGAGNVGYGPFTAGANFSSNEEVNKAIKETFSQDWTGNDWKSIPKTVNVYQVSGSDFQGEAIVRQLIVRPQFSLQTYLTAVSQSFPGREDIARALKNDNRQRFILLPVGSVISYAGDLGQLSSNWMVCDGKALKRVQYPTLFEAIKTAYGDGRDNNNAKLQESDFNLPDYQGFFLRGVDATGERDPDRDKREAPRAGGNDKGRVGSIERDAIQNHKHDDKGHTHAIDGYIYEQRADTQKRDVGMLQNYTGSTPTNPGFAQLTGPTDAGDGAPRTSKETRPMNAYVYWIIRVR